MSLRRRGCCFFPTTLFMFTDSVNSDNSHIDSVKFLCPCKVLSNWTILATWNKYEGIWRCVNFFLHDFLRKKQDPTAVVKLWCPEEFTQVKLSKLVLHYCSNRIRKQCYVLTLALDFKQARGYTLYRSHQVLFGICYTNKHEKSQALKHNNVARIWPQHYLQLSSPFPKTFNEKTTGFSVGMSYFKITWRPHVLTFEYHHVHAMNTTVLKTCKHYLKTGLWWASSATCTFIYMYCCCGS